MKVAIIGSNGLLGAELVMACRRAGLAPVALSREQMDLTQPRQVRDTLPPVSWIINAAAFSDIEGAERHRAQAFAVNSEGARTLAVCCARRGIHLMHISCAGVFDGRKSIPYRESDEPNPINSHALSKLAGEKNVRAEGGKSLIIRLPVLFGAREDSLPAELRAAILEKRFPLKVPSDETVSPAFSRHVAEGLVSLLRHETTGILHVGAPGRCTWMEFARALLERMQQEGPIEEVPSAVFYPSADRPAHTVLDAQRFRQLTGHALPAWQQGLEAWLESLRQGGGLK